MRTLELFAGTQSFTKAVNRLYPDAETVTVDILPLFKPTITTDILLWDYAAAYPPGHFDIIWCSPPCQEYSKAKTRGARDLATADMLVRRCWRIIDYFKPKTWLVENVGTGLLVDRMSAIRHDAGDPYFVDYCAYGAPYRKRTAFWSNVNLTGLGLCEGPGKCPAMTGRRHNGSCGNGTQRYNAAGVHSVWDKDAIPAELSDTLALLLAEVNPELSE